ncbi:hypothetical protein ABK040_000336 [Willaertia magna]
MKVTQHLNRALQAQEKHYTQFEIHLREVLDLLHEKGGDCAYDYSLMANFNSSVYNLKSLNGLIDKMHILLVDQFDQFIKKFIQNKLFKENNELIDNLSIDTFLDCCKVTFKLYSWVKKPLKQVTFNESIRPEEVLIGLFKENILEKDSVKKFVVQYLKDDLKHSVDQAKDKLITSGTDITTNTAVAEVSCSSLSAAASATTVANNNDNNNNNHAVAAAAVTTNVSMCQVLGDKSKLIIKSFVEFGYDKVENIIGNEMEELQQAIQPILESEKKIREDKLRKENESNRRNEFGGSSGGGSSMRNMSYTPVNECPYKEEFVGLKNQGSLCYLNSLIQSLYHLPVFRRIIFQWRYDQKVHGSEEYCVLLQLQKLFARLKLSEHKAIETVNLTKSFGWERTESFIQQDSSEFMRILLENLINEKIPIQEIFEGEYRDYVICNKCNYIGGRSTKYMDLQLVIKNMKHLDEAIDGFQFEELLCGENQYFCEKCNCKVDARKGLKLTSTPDILTLHLKRFDIDYSTFTRIKLNNQIVFQPILDMNKHLNTSTNFQSSEINAVTLDSHFNIYNLFAVLIHSGGSSGGHYYAYIKIHNDWYEFNDSNVSKIDEKQVEKAFGSKDSHANGYLLMYVRNDPLSVIHTSLLDLSEKDEVDLIPEDIKKEIFLENEKYINGQREYELKKQKMEFQIYMYQQDNTLKNVKVEIEKDKKVSDLLQASIDALCKGTSVSDVRVRYFDKNLKVPRDIISDLSTSLKDNMSLINYRNCLLLENTENLLVLEEYNPNQFTIFISKFNGESFDSQIPITLAKDSNILQLKEKIEFYTGIPISKQQIIFSSYYNNSKEFNVLPKVVNEKQENEILLFKTFSIQEGDTLYVEQLSSSDNNSNLMEIDENNNESTSLAIKKLLETQNQIMISIKQIATEKNTSSTSTFEIAVDKRQSIRHLKERIGSILQQHPDEFTLGIGEFSNMESCITINNLDDQIYYHIFNGSTVLVLKEHQLSKPEYTISFYLYDKDEESKGERNTNGDVDKKNKNRRNKEAAEEEMMMDEMAAEYHFAGHHRPLTRYAKRAMMGVMDAIHWRGGGVDPEMGAYAGNRRDRGERPGSNGHSAAGNEEDNDKKRKATNQPPKRVKFEDLENDYYSGYSMRGNSKIKKLFNHSFDKEITVKDLKQFLFEKARNEKSELLTKQSTLNNIRIREKYENRQDAGRILCDDEKPYYSIDVISSNRELIIEKIEKSETITPNHMLIKIARFRPSKWKINSVKEIIVTKDTTVGQLKRLILSETKDLTEDILKIVKISYQLVYHLRDNDYMLKLQWNDLDDKQIITENPWFLKDGDLILFKDETELDWFTLNKNEIEAGNSNSNNNGNDASSSAAGGSSSGGNRERGIRIKTKEEKELMLKQQQEKQQEEKK